ncbi:MAG: glutamyl-tRNA reductase [Bacteroidota bacterium]
MLLNASKDLFSSFFVWGLTYAQADASTRSAYSLTASQQRLCLEKARAHGLQAAMIVSTCNRTELYGFGKQSDILLQSWLETVDQPREAWQRIGWKKTGKEAVAHLFRVSCGLDSQILGDIQIMGQVKSAYAVSKEMGMGHGYMERLLNTCIEAHKAIKNQTALGSGASSVAYLAAQAAERWHLSHPVNSILLIGAGDIGKATCANLRKAFPQTRLSIINRSSEKAELLAEQFSGTVYPWAERVAQVAHHDLIVVATAAESYVLDQSALPANEFPRMIIDLGIPLNVNPAVDRLDHISLLNTDSLSVQIKATQEKRKADIPAAEDLIGFYMEQYAQWLQKRTLAPILAKIQQQASAAQTKWLAEIAPGPAFNAELLSEAGSHLARRFTRSAAKALFAQEEINPTRIQQLESLLIPKA